MGLLQGLRDRRQEQIERKARPFLEEGEEVSHWVRALHPKDGRRGIFFLTERRALVHWSGKEDGHADVPWTDFRTWGVNQDDRQGPVLCIQTSSDETVVVQLAVRTDDQARTAGDFIRSFAEMAPWPEERPAPEGSLGFEPQAMSEVVRHRRTPAELVRRWGLATVGILLCIAGLILALPGVPGPGILVIIAGLALLAREYDWADDLLDWTKDRFEDAKRKVAQRKKNRQKA